MEEFKIERGHTIPNYVPMSKYPFVKMTYGDSFFVPGINKKKARNIADMGRRIFNKVGAKVSIITRPEKDGYRFWAVKKTRK